MPQVHFHVNLSFVNLMHKPLDQVVAVLACLVVAILLLAFLIQFCRERERKSTSEKVRIFFGLKSMFLHLPHEPAGLTEGG